MQPSGYQPEPSRRLQTWGTIAAFGGALFALWLWFSPPYSFHPTCTYTVNARVSADVEIAGQKLSSTVVFQNGRSRRWLAQINSAGCRHLYGYALTFRLADDSILIVPARICHKGAETLARSGPIDVTRFCTWMQAHQDQAFLVDSAARPTRWYAVTNGVDFRIVNLTAEGTRSAPTDDIASVAPNLLKSKFEHGRHWSRSPEPIIPFRRRYQRSLAQSHDGFEFVVRNERF